MTCWTPDLSTLSNLTDQDWPVIASVTFIMDAVGGLVTGKHPVVRYFDDPVVHHFDGYGHTEYLYGDDTYLEIKVSFSLLHCVVLINCILILLGIEMLFFICTSGTPLSGRQNMQICNLE